MNRIKIIAILMLMGLGSFLSAQDLPSPMQPPRLVNDFANILTEQERTTLETKLRNYHDTTSTQLYIVTVIDLQGYDVSDYAIRIGEKWGMGQQGKNNGALILIKPRIGNEQGKAFIATGYGLEDVIPDAIAKRIIEREMIPEFQVENYFRGLDMATTVMINLASGKFSGDGYMGEGGAVFSLLLFLLPLFFVILSNVRKAKARSVGHNIPFWLAMGMMSGGGRSGRSGGFGGFSSGGGSFGGFSGGGGGSFGGGGAGGSW